MKYILLVFNLLNKLKEYLHFDGAYAELNRYMKTLTEPININKALRDEIIECIKELNVEEEKKCVALLLHPDIPCEELPLTETVYDLNDTQLLNYFGAIMWTVSVNEKDNLLLLKYNECIWNTGWHNYALECRGKVIKKDTLQVVSYPFDKFFNLNEHKTSQGKIAVQEISQAHKVSLTNKLDGSTIIVSNYNGSPIITTNGAFSNPHIEWAHEIFEEKYKKFIENVPEGYTFIFELIHPENRIVVDYGDTCDLYLIAVRDNALLECGLCSYDKIKDLAAEYELKVVEQEEFTNLDDLCHKANTMTNANKEGWVVRCEDATGYVPYMFKLKLEEYFMFHRARAHVSIKNVYNLYFDNRLDELLSVADDLTKQEILDTLETIHIYLGKVRTEAINRAESIINKFNINRETIMCPENKDILIKVVQETAKDKLFGPYMLHYIKWQNIENACNRIRLKKFIELYEYFNNADM